jgi:hypothetical protein
MNLVSESAGGTIQVTPADLDAAASVLTGNVAKALSELVTAVQSVHVTVPGFSTAEALRHLSAAWGMALSDLGDTCNDVASGLTYAANTYAEQETAITADTDRAEIEMPHWTGR